MILKAIEYSLLATQSKFSEAKLSRQTEPHRVTEHEQNVGDYNLAMDSAMIAFYALALNLMGSICEASQTEKALDLCSGPGHMTRLMTKFLGFQNVTGVDLSEPMLQTARRNAERENLAAKTTYLKSDIMRLRDLNSNEFDLVSFLNGAHHLDSIEDVRKVLSEAERVAKSSGTIILIDPVRPKSQKILERYHRVGGVSYVEKGFDGLNSDFYDSLLASWTTEELKTAVPFGSQRHWVQMVPFGFSSFQVLIGLPVGRRNLFVKKNLAHPFTSTLVPKEFEADWKLLQFSFKMAKNEIISFPPEKLDCQKSGSLGADVKRL